MDIYPAVDDPSRQKTEYIQVVPPETLRLNKCPDMGEFLFSVNKVMWENSQDMCECNQNYGILQLVVKVR
ncbi:hypothetical protein pipiens_009769 [Culex pipiens pipiens]|uniref:Uncharacterized protein n=1 Tax=Culex pipiens pipiens TaxID=38569 RepID=A0ABD1DCN5_CULPP